MAHARNARAAIRALASSDISSRRHQAIAPTRQARAYIRSCEVSGIVERAHGNVAGKPKRWLEHEK
jgi:hypothetical protein